jgi:hypothetical protein
MSNELKVLEKICPHCSSYFVKFIQFSNGNNFKQPRYQCLNCNKMFRLGGSIRNVKPKDPTHTLNALAVTPKANDKNKGKSKCVEEKDKIENDKDEYKNKFNFTYHAEDEDENDVHIDQDWEDEDNEDEDSETEDSEDEDSETEDSEDEDSEESNNNKNEDEKIGDNSNYIDGVKKMSEEEKKIANESGKNYCFVEYVNLRSLVGINLLKDLGNQVQSNSQHKYRNEDGEEIVIDKQSQFDFLKCIDKEGVEDIILHTDVTIHNF